MLKVELIKPLIENIRILDDINRLEPSIILHDVNRRHKTVIQKRKEFERFVNEHIISHTEFKTLL